MMKVLKISLLATLFFALLSCVVYPLLLFGLGQLLFPDKAKGSLIYEKGGRAVIGSTLIGQNFHSPHYFHPRPSFAGKEGYDGLNSSASNFWPGSSRLFSALQHFALVYRTENHLPDGVYVPVDAATSSGSGLDPHISLANALLQLPRVAAVRSLPEARVRAIVEQCTEKRFLGLLGEERVNVLMLNLKLDEGKSSLSYRE